jgi:energy-coupling factor transporter ATP-binding protein EcfA2
MQQGGCKRPTFTVAQLPPGARRADVTQAAICAGLRETACPRYDEPMEQTNKDHNPITPFAITNYRDIRQRFGIKQKNRRAHLCIVGKTGTGKSTLIQTMARYDIEMGYGIALIDPHGDLAEAILESIPANRINDVVYFNPADLEFPIPFNPLEHVPADRRFLVASGLISVFKKVWGDFWGPRLEHILRNALLTLLGFPGATLLDLPRLLTDEPFRMTVLKRVTHPHVRDFWFSEFGKYSAYLKSEAVAPILNKVGQFVASTPLRNMVGQRTPTTLDFRQMMDEGKILIANLAKGKIGEDNTSLLGAMLVTKIQLAALSRADVPEHERRTFYCYVDEFHNFITMSFADILAESRKYALSLTLASQQLSTQIDERLRSAILGNVGTLISFRVGVEDAKLLAPEFAPTFGVTDLINLPNHHIYLKLLIDGRPSQPFSACTLSPTPTRASYKREIIEQSRQRYARPRSDVERELFRGRGEQSQQSDQGRLI